MTTDQFRVIRGNEPHDPTAARQRLEQQMAAISSRNLGQSADRYFLDPSLEVAINMAVAVQAPLLVTGEPGTGKTQVAHYLSCYLGIELFSFQVQSTSTAKDLRYEFDAVGYLHWAQSASKQELDRERYVTKNALWLAYEQAMPSVVLIDEIDKAPRDFPNDLLHELDQHSFPHPFHRTPDDRPELVEPKANRPPTVIVTSNAERRLPDAFLRRCIHHHVDLTPSFVRQVVSAHSATRFPDLAEAVRDLALGHFETIRRLPLGHRPATAELLNWLAVLSALGVQEEQIKVLNRNLPGLPALIKDQQDLKQLPA